jgi:hypothetical protein
MLRRIRTRCRLIAPAAALAAMLFSAWPTGLALCLQADGCLEVELVAPAGRPDGEAASGGCLSDHCRAAEHIAGRAPMHAADPSPVVGDDHATAGCRDFTVTRLPALVTQHAWSGSPLPEAPLAGAWTAGPTGRPAHESADSLAHDLTGPPPGLFPPLTAVRTTVRLC